jgi:hypothetical protein
MATKTQLRAASRAGHAKRWGNHLPDRAVVQLGGLEPEAQRLVLILVRAAREQAERLREAAEQEAALTAHEEAGAPSIGGQVNDRPVE